MKKIFFALAVVLVVIQFIQIDKTNPTVDESQDFLKTYSPSPEITAQIKASCYDCHSNESLYPWYANVQPAGWFLKHHIDEGRHELNFSEFGSYSAKKQAHKLEESIELIEKGEMPLSSYTIMHKDAVLDDASKKALVEYFKSIQKNIQE
ncbi:heme-binding domain-containing protein [Flavobacterium chuncheonense]|uniref:Heme-binding domain-containing protein n=1 Tax=Flavobacterium chuncheonense TaxID=2026653 RepID=A0ABW5YLY2_9FLAO